MRTRTRTLTSFLRHTTYTHLYGERVGDMGVRPSHDKAEFIRRYNSRRFDKLNNNDFNQHFACDQTYYFWGAPEISAELSLVMGDIDVKKARGKGSYEGALKFVKYLKANFWPDLYYERSTNGNGIHFYVLIRKIDVGGRRLNLAIDQLERFLVHQARGFDIEQVEVKGKAPEIKWGEGGITDIKYGTFAKFPREATHHDLVNTTVIDYSELHCMNGAYDVPPEPKQKTTLHSGSGSANLPADFNENHSGNFEEAYLKLTGGEIFMAGPFAVTGKDAGTFGTIALWLQENGRKTSHLPVRTMMRYWQDMYDRGLTTRAPNARRIKVIRDFLSGKGIINWIDHTYQPPSEPGAKDGIACKWRLDEGFVTLLLSGGGNVDSEFRGKGENYRPTMKLLREEAEWRREEVFWDHADRELGAIFAEAA